MRVFKVAFIAEKIYTTCEIGLSYMDHRRKHFIVEISLTLVSDDYVIFCVISESIFYFDSICIIIKFKPINVASCHHVTLINLFTRGESHANFQITFFFFWKNQMNDFWNKTRIYINKRFQQPIK